MYNVYHFLGYNNPLRSEHVIYNSNSLSNIICYFNITIHILLFKLVDLFRLNSVIYIYDIGNFGTILLSDKSSQYSFQILFNCIHSMVEFTYISIFIKGNWIYKGNLTLKQWLAYSAVCLLDRKYKTRYNYLLSWKQRTSEYATWKIWNHCS